MKNVSKLVKKALNETHVGMARPARINYENIPDYSGSFFKIKKIVNAIKNTEIQIPRNDEDVYEYSYDVRFGIATRARIDWLNKVARRKLSHFNYRDNVDMLLDLAINYGYIDNADLKDIDIKSYNDFDDLLNDYDSLFHKFDEEVYDSLVRQPIIEKFNLTEDD